MVTWRCQIKHFSGMDHWERRAFLEALAELHASTYYLMSKHSGGMQGYLDEHQDLVYIKEFDPEEDVMMIKDCVATLEALACELIDGKTADKIKKFEPHAFEKWHEAYIKPYGEFQTIIHGDAWINNAMFK